MTYRLEPFSDHDIEGFDCGVDELDTWLTQSAHTATGQGTRTYLLIDDDTEAVAGYFAIAPHYLRRDETPRPIARGAPAKIPAILLAKLALDRSHQGSGLGSELLVTALATIIEAAKHAGGRLVVVDAVNDTAHRFYHHHNFTPLPGHDRRLIVKLSTVARALGIDWP